MQNNLNHSRTSAPGANSESLDSTATRFARLGQALGNEIAARKGLGKTVLDVVEGYADLRKVETALNVEGIAVFSVLHAAERAIGQLEKLDKGKTGISTEILRKLQRGLVANADTLYTLGKALMRSD